ncbi:molecular chaperone DnaJ [Egicoccus halophilus]|uniref:Chaperone protein DnaJ n=1 Tax=Egicoccus halophilus TaxID=1670830 RepID=A0A8J3EZ61_9ACTN|nr:molecular chaperone DnaJ [Egicoccus halophilus]GGI09255.1 chaperone protein DnaJ [Egicoccus halophilus]
MPDLYDLLDVPRDASAEDIKRAYRRQARQHHPDAGGDEETFKQLTHAYQVLSDPQKRARYDRFGDDGTPQSRGAGQDPFGFGAGGGFGGIGDVIDAFFGSAFGGASAGGGGGRNRQTPGRDVLVGVELELEDVVTGVHREVVVEVASACELCGGSGSASGRPPGACGTCGGSGQVQRVVRTAFGQLATAAPCTTCEGSGRRVADPCTGCGGEGRRAQRRTLGVDVPAGVDEGDRLRVAGAGEAGRHGAPAGDLYVEVRLAPHDWFEREGRDLVAEITVPVTQAALGGTVRVPTVDGAEVEIEVPAGTQSGDELLVRRAGLPSSASGRRGDLRLVVRVETPTGLSAEQRQLLTELAELRGEDLAADGRSLFTRLRDAFQR